MSINLNLTGPCDCGAPEGDCWSQAASMGGKPWCGRDETVGYGRDEWLALVEQLEGKISGIKNELYGRIDELNADNDQPAPTTSMGCICPPTSEQTCQNPLCPRRGYSLPVTSSVSGGNENDG